MMLLENTERRNPQVFSDDDRMIAEAVNDMKRHLKAINSTVCENSIFEEMLFDQKYEFVIKKLDENNWKNE